MKKSKTLSPKPAGFALVVTLSLMILLTIIAVGLLTLSSVALRSSSQGQAMSEARANARLALMLAIGDLQKWLGRDQSVSAPASSVIRNAARPRLTGAWSGWHWTPSPTGSPDYNEKKSTFVKWLVSSTDPASPANFGFASNAPPVGNTAAELVRDRPDSQGVSTRFVAQKVPTKSTSSIQTGNLAWAVFDESTKAPVDLGDTENSNSPSLEIASRSATERARPDALDARLAALETPVNLISLETASISTDNTEIRRRFHDFTTGSLGLLTDTANGGLKTDLTQLLEPDPRSGSDPLPAGAFDRDTPYPVGFETADGAISWAYIQDHYQKYKNITVSSGVPTYQVTRKSPDLKVVRNGPGGTLTGLSESPEIERLLAAIARIQLVFSVVSHEPVPGGRRDFLNRSGDPKGYQNYGVVMLACDPVITLYNPYDVSLRLDKTRIRIWDPPVAFRFRKFDMKAGTAAYFRQDGGFATLAYMQIANVGKTNARKCYTLVLSDGEPRRASRSLTLMPGEVKVFSPRVEDTWTWGLENSQTWSGTGTATFFDWDVNRNFGNVDMRTNAINGTFGMECIPRWDGRAGLQEDHLADPRSQASKYSFESGTGDRFVTIRKTDEVEVEIQPQVASGQAVTEFQVDVMAGLRTGSSTTGISSDLKNTGEIGDTLRSYRFNFANTKPSDELSENPANPIIKRRYAISDIFQADNDRGKGGKKPFAMLEMSARYTKDTLTDSKPWLYNNFVVEGGIQNTSEVGLPLQAYDLRLIEMTSFDSFPGGIEIDPDTYRGYFGASGSVNEGSSFVNMLRVPLVPAASLGDLVSTNLASGSLLPRVVHPFGNSHAHPLISAGKISETNGNLMMDHSYLLNASLWDSYFFSSITDYGDGAIMPTRSMQSVLEGVFKGTEPAVNSRIVPAGNPGDAESLAREISSLGDVERSRKIAKHIAVEGPFNVNSTSVDAWRAVLSGMRDRAVRGVELDATGNNLSDATYDNDKETPFVRAGKPIAGSDAPSFLRWAGFRALTDSQIEKLSKAIVEEILKRGEKDSAPSLTLGEFVNRRLDSGDLAGLLQTAINKTDINDESVASDSKTLSYSKIPPARRTGVKNDATMNGSSAEGAPTMITQGDLMTALASVATVRGDTFKIRSYGEATTPDGKTVLARAWCEAVVQRVPEYIDPTDEPQAVATTDLNKTFGRRFKVVSFRWLDASEL